VKIRYIWSDFTNLSMDYASIAVLIGTMLAAASVVFGAKYNQGKAKAKELVQLLTEVIEAPRREAKVLSDSAKLPTSNI